MVGNLHNAAYQIRTFHFGRYIHVSGLYTPKIAGGKLKVCIVSKYQKPQPPFSCAQNSKKLPIRSGGHKSALQMPENLPFLPIADNDPG